MSRIGKIARLPKAVREELNRRMEDGEEGKGLVAWLNGHSEVHPPSPGLRRAGAAECDRQPDWVRNPINESNLTAWRQGGFEDWRRQQESLELAGRMMEETGAIAETMARQETGDGRQGTVQHSCLVDRVAMMAALAIGQELMAVRRMEEGAEKRKAVLKLVRGLVRLRNSDRACERGMREAAQAARAAEVHEDWAASRRAQAKRNVWSGAEHGGVDVRKKMAEVMEKMSDEQIAESLRRSGYLPAAEAPKQVWWTDEDQAFEEAELAKEEAAAKAAEEAARAADARGQRSDISGRMTAQDEEAKAARTLNAERLTSNAEVPGTAILPPEGGTTSTSTSTSTSMSTNLPPEGGTQPSPGGYGGQATSEGRAGGGLLRLT